MSLPNVAIFGKFCAGKTTLARELEDNYGFSRVSMAANMKYLVEQVYGTQDKSASVEVARQDGSVESISVRRVLQRFGENAKGHDLHFWLRWLLADLGWLNPPFALDDGRLPFEATELQKRGWVVVKLEVPEEIRMERYQKLYGRVPTEAEATAPTEMLLDTIKYDYVFDGTMQPESLAENLIELLADAKKWRVAA